MTTLPAAPALRDMNARCLTCAFGISCLPLYGAMTLQRLFVATSALAVFGTHKRGDARLVPVTCWGYRICLPGLDAFTRVTDSAGRARDSGLVGPLVSPPRGDSNDFAAILGIILPVFCHAAWPDNAYHPHS